MYHNLDLRETYEITLVVIYFFISAGKIITTVSALTGNPFNRDGP